MFNSSLNPGIDVFWWELMKILIPPDIGLTLTLVFRLKIPDTVKQFIIMFTEKRRSLFRPSKYHYFYSMYYTILKTK